MLPQITLDRSSGNALHTQVGNEVRRLVLSRALSPGTRLPSTRRAAAELGVSRNVVVLAYEPLVPEGYLRSRVGAGTWVPESLDAHLRRPTSPPEANGGDAAVWSRRCRRRSLPSGPASTRQRTGGPSLSPE